MQAPIRKKPLLLYLALSPSAIGGFIAQEDGGLLHKSHPKGCGDLLPHSQKGVLGNSLCITKIVPLFLSLWDTIDEKVSCHQSPSPTNYSFRKDILVVVTIATIWLEGRNTQDGKKSSHRRLARPISRQRGISIGRWSSKRGGHNISNQRAMGHEIRWLFYSKLRGHKSGPLLQKRRDHGTLIQIGVSMFQQYCRMQGLSYQAGHSLRDGDQTFESNRWLQLGGLPSQGEFLIEGTEFGSIQDAGPKNGRKVFHIQDRACL